MRNEDIFKEKKVSFFDRNEIEIEFDEASEIEEALSRKFKINWNFRMSELNRINLFFNYGRN